MKLIGSGAAASKRELAELERALGAKLPSDYRRFIAAQNGGEPALDAAQWFWLDAAQRKKDRVDYVYPVRSAERVALPVILNEGLACRPRALLPIASTQSGHGLALVVAGPARGKVVLEKPEALLHPRLTPAQLARQEALVVLAPSFEAFIAALFVAGPGERLEPLEAPQPSNSERTPGRAKRLTLERGRPCSALALAALERVIKAKLPRDYRAFLRARNGGSPTRQSPARFVVNPATLHEDFVDRFYRIDLEHDETCTLPHAWHEARRELPRALLPIADNGSGDRVCLVLRGANAGAVLHLAHELLTLPTTSMRALRTQEGCTQLAKSFTAFLRSLY